MSLISSAHRSLQAEALSECV